LKKFIAAWSGASGTAMFDDASTRLRAR
jgi:hypothetical protein